MVIWTAEAASFDCHLTVDVFKWMLKNANVCKSSRANDEFNKLRSTNFECVRLISAIIAFQPTVHSCGVHIRCHLTAKKKKNKINKIIMKNEKWTPLYLFNLQNCVPMTQLQHKMQMCAFFQWKIYQWHASKRNAFRIKCCAGSNENLCCFRLTSHNLYTICWCMCISNFFKPFFPEDFWWMTFNFCTQKNEQEFFSFYSKHTPET